MHICSIYSIFILSSVMFELVQAEHLEALLEPVGKHVRSYYGNQGGGSLPKDTAIAVCTIEKANSLINRLLEEGRLSELGIIVIDELHMVLTLKFFSTIVLFYFDDIQAKPLHNFKFTFCLLGAAVLASLLELVIKCIYSSGLLSCFHVRLETRIGVIYWS